MAEGMQVAESVSRKYAMPAGISTDYVVNVHAQTTRQEMILDDLTEIIPDESGRGGIANPQFWDTLQKHTVGPLFEQRWGV